MILHPEEAIDGNACHDLAITQVALVLGNLADWRRVRDLMTRVAVVWLDCLWEDFRRRCHIRSDTLYSSPSCLVLAEPLALVS
jgi:hypothetical protein